MNDKIPTRLDLSWPEIWFGINAGVGRRLHALRNGKRGIYGANNEHAWDNDINGAIAELACAKWANVFWNGTIGVTTSPDVGKWQIRSKVVTGHRLVVRPTDDDAQIYISVLVELPTVTLCGWLTGAEAKRQEWLHEYPPKPAMYFIEDQYLRDMEELRVI